MQEEQELATWKAFTEAWRLYEKSPSELNAIRAVKRFQTWAMAFSPETAKSDTAILRSRLRGF